MTTYLAAGAIAVATLPFTRIVAALGKRPRAPVRAGDSPRAQVTDTARLLAAVASLPLLVGEGGGDLVVGGALVALAAARSGPLLPAAALLIAATATTRVGATAVADVAAAHVVLGPAVQSPQEGVAIAAGFAAAAGLAIAVALVPTRPRRGGRAMSRGTDVPEAVALVALGLLTVVALMGPPFAGGPEDAAWIALRFGVAFGIAVVAAVMRRVIPSVACARAPEAAALLGLTGFLVGGLSA